MRDIAECLSEEEPFLRIDLYDIGRPMFGEIAMHPETGLGRWDPPEWDQMLGRLWGANLTSIRRSAAADSGK
jgi:hypothetical protein